MNKLVPLDRYRDDDFDAPESLIYDDALAPEEPQDFARDLDERWTVAAPASDCDTSNEGSPPKLNITSPADTFGIEPPPRQWIVPDWIPRGVVTGLYGDGGVGKSLLAQQLQTACAIGGEWAGQMCEPVRSLGAYCEDDADELARRQAAINSLYGVSRDDLRAVNYISRLGDDNALMTFDRHGRGEMTAFYKQILEAAKDTGARLVVFDTAADGFVGNENDRSQVRQFVSRGLGSIALAINGAVLLCAHPSRSGKVTGEGDGGSTAWSNTLRSRLYMSTPDAEDGRKPDANARILSRKKANYAARNDEVRLLWNRGAFIVDAPESSMFRPPADDVFVALLDAMLGEGRKVSHSKMANNYAPRAFASHPDRQGYRQADFEAAMERLFAEKRIRVDESGPPSKRVQWIVKTGWGV